jgi:uncharacterized membrane protein YhfC
MLYVLYPINALLMIGLPIALGLVLASKTRARWALFGLGAVTFVGSQVVHIPLNWALGGLFKSWWPSGLPQPWQTFFNPVFLGLSAGLCEETARYVGYRWLAPRSREFRDGMMMGAGHGGIEAIVLGVLAGLAFFSLAQARGMDLAAQGLSGDTLRQVQAQVASYWSAPWYMALLGAVERVFTLAAHIGFSILVLQVFVRHSLAWYGIAVGAHALFDGVAVIAVQAKWPALSIEGALGLVALATLGTALALKPKGRPLVPLEPVPVLVDGASGVPDPGQRRERQALEEIDNSRYA